MKKTNEFKLRKPRVFFNVEDLPDDMQDRQNVIYLQRMYAKEVGRKANDLSKEIVHQAFRSMSSDSQMYFCWSESIANMMESYVRLCELSDALYIIERDLRDIHESQKDDKPF